MIGVVELELHDREQRGASGRHVALTSAHQVPP